MPKIIRKIIMYVCDNCGHEWEPRKLVKKPVCPKCHHPA